MSHADMASSQTSDDDVIVIGGGSSGEHGAGARAEGGPRRAGRARARRWRCSYWACIPSKTLELELWVEEPLRRFPTLGLDGECDRLASTFLNQYHSIPVTLEAGLHPDAWRFRLFRGRSRRAASSAVGAGAPGPRRGVQRRRPSCPHRVDYALSVQAAQLNTGVIRRAGRTASLASGQPTIEAVTAPRVA
ncbi:MAG: hypothetical protein QOH43_2497 [Solirubrobacteraceae bacterium]|nr:hypothetical protein [Solirubrobacteraceae bacterium]